MNSFPKRPTNREIGKRLKEAREALEQRKGLFANPSKAVGELFELEIGETEELWVLILDLLGEIELCDYSGAFPPLKSYEPEIANCELYAFTWNSSLLNKKMYLKFAMKNGYFYHVSLHESTERIFKHLKHLQSDVYS